jgi:hypothetical protein
MQDSCRSPGDSYDVDSAETGVWLVRVVVARAPLFERETVAFEVLLPGSADKGGWQGMQRVPGVGCWVVGNMQDSCRSPGVLFMLLRAHQVDCLPCHIVVARAPLMYMTQS